MDAFSMAAHRHDRREIYRGVLLRFRGRIEIDHSYGRPHLCCAGSGSTNHSSADRIVVNSYSKLTIIGSDNGLSPGRRQPIIWTNDGIILIGPSGTKFRKILIEIHTFLFKTMMHLQMSSGKQRPFSLRLNMLKRKVSRNPAGSHPTFWILSFDLQRIGRIISQ